MSLAIKHFYRFGDFVVDRDQKVLLRNGKPLALAPKVFDTLLILIDESGRIVEKEALMNRLWPETFVEESNLTFNVQQLRKALGDNARRPRFIETVPRRGYRFIANLEDVSSEDSTKPSLSESIESPANLSLSSKAAPDSSLKRTHKRFIAVASVVLVLLSGAGLMFWKLSSGNNRNLGELMAALPLKVEKVTAAGKSGYVAISPDGKYLAYTLGFANRESIWLRQLATNTNVEIVPGETHIYGLVFANSGEYLYFVRGRPTALYRVSLLGGVPVKIVDNLEGKFSLSPDDQRIAFVRHSTEANGEQAYALIISKSDGSAERVLLIKNYPDKLDAPAWSPDGDSIICSLGSAASGSQGMGLIEVRVSDGTMRELSNEKFANIARIVWLPRKSGLLLTATKDPNQRRQLWRVSYPGMNFRELTAGTGVYSDLSITSQGDKIAASEVIRGANLWIGESRLPQTLKRITVATDYFCWTPNRRLIFSSAASGSNDLWSMQPDGSEQKQLTVKSGSNGNPVSAGDNRYIVFISNRTGIFQVWRMNIDGGNQVQLTSGGGKNFPSTSPDGKWILFNSTDDWVMWKTSIDGGQPTRLTDYAAYFPAVSPDEKLIACLGRSGSKAALLIVPFTGGPPLKTFDLNEQNFSVNRIQWSADGEGLIYATELDGVTTLFKQPLKGGKAEEIAKFEDEVVFDFGYSLDGQMLAVLRGAWESDVVLISDLDFR